MIDALVAGSLSEPAKAVLMLGAPEHMAALAAPMSAADAAAIIGGLPLEVAAPLRDLVVPPEAALTAILTAHMIIF